jgi:hypothetical protein
MPSTDGTLGRLNVGETERRGVTRVISRLMHKFQPKIHNSGDVILLPKPLAPNPEPLPSSKPKTLNPKPLPGSKPKTLNCSLWSQ